MDKFKCKVCNGKGKWPVVYCYGVGKLIEYYDTIRFCPTCGGRGYLDWVNHARGPTPKFELDILVNIPDIYWNGSRIYKLHAYYIETREKV